MRRFLITIALFSLAAASPGTAAVPERMEAAPPISAAALARVPVASFSLPARDVLAREDAQRRADGLPYRYAVPEDVAFTPGNSGTWSVAEDGRRVWRLRIATPGAVSLNLGFSLFDVPASARLAVYPTDDPAAGLVWDEEDVRPHLELWTPIIRGDEIVVELAVDPAEAGLVGLEIGTVGRGYRGFGTDAAAKAGACNVDVVCPEADDWRDEIKSVAAFSTGGSRFCTGAMINNTAEDGRPLFLTADHCGIWSGNQASVVVYWNYESPSCGLQSGGDESQFQSGSRVLARYAATDFSLLELDDQPPPAYDVRWAGWDRRARNNRSSVCIHHPSGDEKSISFDADTTRVTTYLFDISPGDGFHLQVDAWDLGTTEGGSSGSPLFNEDHRITGQLHGGYASCALPDTSDWFGWLAMSWEGGGSPNNRLRDHLDPLDTGLEYLSMLGKGFDLDPVADVRFEGGPGGPFTPDQSVYTLENSLVAPRGFRVEVIGGGDWLEVTPATGILGAGESTNLTVDLDDTVAAGLAPGTHTGRVRIVADPAGILEHEIAVSLVVFAPRPVVTATAPNPSQGLLTIHYSMGFAGTVRGRVYDLRGRRVAEMGPWDATVGEHEEDWVARDSDGARLPSGVYVLELESRGEKGRRSFAIVR